MKQKNSSKDKFLEYVEEHPDYGVCLKYNNTATNDPCAICGERTDPHIGLELFLEGTWALVCVECGMKTAPELVLITHPFEYRALGGKYSTAFCGHIDCSFNDCDKCRVEKLKG